MEAQFKFKIGDMVVPKARWELVKFCVVRDAESKAVPDIMTVIQRTMEECPGGVQYHYLCRPWMTGLEDKIIRFNEVELQAYSLDECLAIFGKRE